MLSYLLQAFIFYVSLAIGPLTGSEGTTWVPSSFKSTANDVLPTAEPKLDNGLSATVDFPPWRRWLSWAKSFRSQPDASTKPSSRWRRWTTRFFSRSPVLPTVEPESRAPRLVVHPPINRKLAAELERRCNSWVSSTLRSSTPIQLFAGPKRAVTEPIKRATLPTQPADECAAPITDTASGSVNELSWSAADNEHAQPFQELFVRCISLTLPPSVLEYCEDYYPDTSVEKTRKMESPAPEPMPVSQILPSMLDGYMDAGPEASINPTAWVETPSPEPEPKWLLPIGSGCASPSMFESCLDLEEVDIAAPVETPLPVSEWFLPIDSSPSASSISEKSIELDELLVAIGIRVPTPLSVSEPKQLFPIDSALASPSMSESSMELDELLVAIGVRVPTPLPEPEPKQLFPTDSAMASPSLSESSIELDELLVAVGVRVSTPLPVPSPEWPLSANSAPASLSMLECIDMNHDEFIDLEELMEHSFHCLAPSSPMQLPLSLPLLESYMDNSDIFADMAGLIGPPLPAPKTESSAISSPMQVALLLPDSFLDAQVETPVPEPEFLCRNDSALASPSMSESSIELDELLVAIGVRVRTPLPVPSPEWPLSTDSALASPSLSESSIELDELLVAIGVRVPTPLPVPSPEWPFPADSAPALPSIVESCMDTNPDGFADLEDLIIPSLHCSCSSSPTLVPLPMPLPLLESYVDDSGIFADMSSLIDPPLPAPEAFFKMEDPVETPLPMSEPTRKWSASGGSIQIPLSLLESCMDVDPQVYVDLVGRMETPPPEPGRKRSTSGGPIQVPLPLLLESCMDVDAQVYVEMVGRMETPPPEPEPDIDHTQAPAIFPRPSDDPAEYLYTVSEVHSRISYRRATLITSPSCAPPPSTEYLQRIVRPLARLWRRPHGRVSAVQCTWALLTDQTGVTRR